MCHLPIPTLHKRHRKSHKTEPPTPPPTQPQTHHTDRLAYEAQQRDSYTAARIAFAAHQQRPLDAQSHQHTLRFNNPRPAPAPPNFTNPRPAPQPPHVHFSNPRPAPHTHHIVRQPSQRIHHAHTTLSRADSRRRAQERLRAEILRVEKAERARVEARAERKRAVQEEQARYAEEQWKVLVEGGRETSEARQRVWEDVRRRKVGSLRRRRGVMGKGDRRGGVFVRGEEGWERKGEERRGVDAQ